MRTSLLLFSTSALALALVSLHGPSVTAAPLSLVELNEASVEAAAIEKRVVGLNDSGVQATLLEKREVGTLSCETVKTGHLALVNKKTGESYSATLDNNYRLDDALEDKKKPDSVQGIGNPRILSSYDGITSDGDVYNFQACTESKRPGFEDYAAKTKSGVYHGHLSPQNAPHHCLIKRSIYADDIILTSEKCSDYLSDDSGSTLAYFRLSQEGVVHFLQYTGKNGGYPRPSDAGTFTFSPGTEDEPAVYVHDGSPDFSEYELRLV